MPVSPAPSSGAATGAEGVWAGALSDGREYNLFVLDDASAWLFYSAGRGQNAIRGVIQGSAVVNGPNVAVLDAKDFELAADSVADAAIAGAFSVGATLSGNVTYAGAPSRNVAIGTGSYASVWNDTPATVALAGTYLAASLKTIGPDEVVNVSIVPVGTTAALAVTLGSGCVLTGTFAPRARGNAYAFAGQWGTAPCANPGEAIRGSAFLQQPNVGLKQLTLWWTDPSRGAAYVLTGVRS